MSRNNENRNDGNNNIRRPMEIPDEVKCFRQWINLKKGGQKSVEKQWE